MFTTRKNTLNGLQQLPESVRKGARIEDAQQDEGRSSGSAAIEIEATFALLPSAVSSQIFRDLMSRSSEIDG